MEKIIVELRNVTKKYPLGKLEVEALKGITFRINAGDFISVSGPSGSGKTTILNLIGCLDIPTTGTVSIDGRQSCSLSDNGLSELRHEKIGFIFQSFNLMPVLNVFENIEFPLILGKKKDRKSYIPWIQYLMEEVGLQDRSHHKPNELSGGQRQRVAIARALVTKPDIVLADEPTANLDSHTGASIIELMKKINREQRTTFIFSTHDEKITAIADHVIKLTDGLVVDELRKSAKNSSQLDRVGKHDE